MYVRKATKQDVLAAAERLDLIASGFSRDEEKGLSFQLHPRRERWEGFDPTWHSRGRLVCGHGHSAFIEELLTAKPQAEVETVIGTHRGLADFHARREEIWQRYLKRYPKNRCACKNGNSATGPDGL